MRRIAFTGLIVVSLLLLGNHGARGSDKPATPQPILHLSNGDFAAGQLQDTAEPSILRWQCDSFARPFEFNLPSINAVHFPLPAQPPKATGEYGFELAGGDVLFGSLVSLSEKEVVIDSATFGKLHLRRDHVRRLMRWGDAAGFVYVGPSGLSGWKEPTATTTPTARFPEIRGVMGVMDGPVGILQPAQPAVADADPFDPAGAPAAPQPPPQQPSAPAQPQWWQETGHAVTDRPGASIYADVGLPAQAIIEVELSWRNKPDFVLSLADSDQTSQPVQTAAEVLRRVVGAPALKPRVLGDNQKAVLTAEDQLGAAFRIEVLGANVILMRDLGTTADLVLLDNLGPGAGRIRWQVYLDQERGGAVVYSNDGKQLGELVLDDKTSKSKVSTGVRLVNKRGDIRLERLRVSRWNGELPQKIDSDKSRLHRADGSIVYGEAKGYDAQRKQFIIASKQNPRQESRLDAGQVTSIVLSSAEVPQTAAMCMAMQNGVRVSGNLVKIEGGRIVLSSAAIVELLSAPIAQLQSLLMLQRTQPSARDLTWQSGDGSIRAAAKNQAETPRQTAGRTGRLETEGLRLHGELVDGEADAAATCLVWRPIGSKSGSPLRQGVSGRIVYRELPPEPLRQVATPANRVAQPRAQKALILQQRVAVGRNVESTARTPSASFPQNTVSNPSLHLRVGDNIPCEVKRIDDKGVTFHSPVTDATFIANEKVKAVELAPEQQTKNIGKTKRERLLTLPRMQKNNPPTHLIVSKNGDYLRGRLSELDEKMLALEVRLETRQLPRGNIAKIVWFHPEVTDGESDTPPAPLGAGLVQTLRRDGARLTFQPQRCDEGVLSGKSEVLGQCRVDVSLVDQVLFGKAIDDAQAQLAYHPWKLQDAVEPKYVQDEANEDAAPPPSGTEAQLVGQPAPDFVLPLLGGGAFKLSQHKGSVIVLDFFATWCGPCVQAMPQVDRTVEEFKNQGVKLIAVNMQEEPKKISDLLERLNLKTTVAMDRDGATAEKYGVTAIPQTVVIDAEGKVARVFIGGGAKLPEQLAEALRSTLSPKKPAENAN